MVLVYGINTTAQAALRGRKIVDGPGGEVNMILYWVEQRSEALRSSKRMETGNLRRQEVVGTL